MKIYELSYCRYMDQNEVLGIFTKIDKLKTAYLGLEGGYRDYTFVTEHESDVLDIKCDLRHTWDEEDFHAVGIEPWPVGQD